MRGVRGQGVELTTLMIVTPARGSRQPFSQRFARCAYGDRENPGLVQRIERELIATLAGGLAQQSSTRIPIGAAVRGKRRWSSLGNLVARFNQFERI
jgi:hypothetical protein